MNHLNGKWCPAKLAARALALDGIATPDLAKCFVWTVASHLWLVAAESRRSFGLRHRIVDSLELRPWQLLDP